jgi:hypothetical protein
MVVMPIASQMGGAVVMTIAGHMGGAIVGGKPELLEVRKAASVGGLFILDSRCRRDVDCWHLVDIPTVGTNVRFRGKVEVTIEGRSVR